MQRTRRQWLTSDADLWGGRLPLVLWAGILTVLATFGGTLFLVTGDSPHGRWAGVAALAVAAVLGTLVVLLVRRRAKMWHALLAGVIVASSGLGDSWLNSDRPRVHPLDLALLGWLLVDWLTYPRFRAVPDVPPARRTGHADGLIRPEDAGCQNPPAQPSDS